MVLKRLKRIIAKINTSDEFDLVIEPGQGVKNFWRDIWHYRELFYFLAWRDITVRYKQTVIGILWALIRPLLTMLVFTVVFGSIAKLPSNGVPYPILVYVAMLPWQFFSSAFTESSNSLLANAGMLTKIYFPRLIMPASGVIVSFVDFLISFLILAVLMIWYKCVPSIYIFTLPFFLLLAFIASLGMGLWFAALNVKYRDFRFIIPFVAQFGLYISPVGFSSNIIPANWRLLYSLNPMVGVIDGFRWAILGGDSQIYLPGFILSCLFTVVVFIVGLSYFRKLEQTFADII